MELKPTEQPAKTSGFNEEQIIRDCLSRLAIKHNFCVDIGAGDGRTMSNTYPLFQAGWEGLAAEFDAGKFARLANLYAGFAGARLSRGRVTPENVLNLLAAFGVPREFGFLNLDIDGYDHYVLETLLSAFRPSLICTEINEKIPPPLRFTVKWHPHHGWAGDHFYGQSISMLADLADRHSYDLVDLEYANAFLVAREVNPMAPLTAEHAYQKGYALRADRLQRMPWNQNMEPLQTMEAAQARSFVQDFFRKYQGKFILE